MFVVLGVIDLLLKLTDELDRTYSLTREELLRILETVYQNKCANEFIGTSLLPTCRGRLPMRLFSTLTGS